MSAFTWNEKYATGIASIDDQHRSLFQSVQELHDAYRSGKAREAIPLILEQLVDYSSQHFEDEEAEMERAAFPGLPRHREEHRTLMAQVHNLQERYVQGEPQLPMELSILLSRWLKNHIKDHDMAFAHFVCRNPGAPPTRKRHP
jgi:hemerythrin